MDPESYLIPAAEALIEVNKTSGGQYEYIRLWRLIATGLVPAQRVRGRWRIRRSDLPLVAEVLRNCRTAA